MPEPRLLRSLAPSSRRALEAHVKHALSGSCFLVMALYVLLRSWPHYAADIPGAELA